MRARTHSAFSCALRKSGRWAIIDWYAVCFGGFQGRCAVVCNQDRSSFLHAQFQYTLQLSITLFLALAIVILAVLRVHRFCALSPFKLSNEELTLLDWESRGEKLKSDFEVFTNFAANVWSCAGVSQLSVREVSCSSMAIIWASLHRFSWLLVAVQLLRCSDQGQEQIRNDSTNLARILTLGKWVD